MKKLTCEMCGSTDLLKSDGVFVCQSCGTKYSVEEAKKMMIEGTVQIEGTVKIDNSNNVNNLIKNAKVLYKDGKVDEAYKLFGDVLNIDTENYTALAYRGLCSAWHTTVVNPQINDAVKGITRGIEASKKELGETREYTEFCVEIANEMSSISVACMNLFKKHYTDTANKVATWFEKSKGKVNMYNASYYKEACEKEKKRYDKAQKTALDGIHLTLVASNIVMVVISTVNDDTIFSIEEYEKFKEIVNKYMAVPSEFLNEQLDDYEIGLGFIIMFDNKIKAIGKKQRDQYFAEHPEEKQKLLDEIKETTARNKELQMKIKHNQNEIEQIENYIEETTKPLLLEIKSLDKKISNLEEEKSGLGLFKMKEKKEFDKKIESLEEEKEKLKNKIKLEKIELKKEKENDLSKLESEINKNVKEIEKNNRLLEKAHIKLDGEYDHKDDIVIESLKENKAISKGKLHCSNCGASINDNDKFCPGCGAQFESDDENGNDNQDVDLKAVLGID